MDADCGICNANAKLARETLCAEHLKEYGELRLILADLVTDGPLPEVKEVRDLLRRVNP